MTMNCTSIELIMRMLPCNRTVQPNYDLYIIRHRYKPIPAPCHQRYVSSDHMGLNPCRQG
jgi:hypothetical protein